MKKPEYLSTGEVAAILGVTRATVVHWINDGKLTARKTPGKHNRIMKEDLRALFPQVFDARGIDIGTHQYCWEFYKDDESKHKCEKCLIFRVRAAYCFKLAKEVGHKCIFCDSACNPESCEYYRLFHKEAD